MKNSLLVLITLFAGLLASAQETTRRTVAVTINDTRQKPVESATLEILSAKDSVLVKAALTDAGGAGVLENVPAGNYILRVTAVQFAIYHSPPFLLAAGSAHFSLPVITLEDRAVQLEKVTVSARKPFIQKLADRIVVNVENSMVNAGSSAMDVLDRSPGVNIDQNDVLSLRGRSGVIIMIDGKPTAMAGTDLANYLRSLPAAAIERIDIITNPSSKYDAAGNSGIIDIRMKKDQRLGSNGTVTAGYGQGIYPKANAGGTFNYRNRKINVFGNYNYAYRLNLNQLILDRSFFNNGVYNGGDLKDNYSKSPFTSNTIRSGMDYFQSKKTIIGFVINSNLNRYKRNSQNSSIVIDPERKYASTFRSIATNNDRSNNAVANINLKHTIDTTGKEISADLDYGIYSSSSLSGNATSYYKLDNTSLQPDYILDGDQQGTLTLKTAKIDFVNPLKKGAKLEAGLKTSFVSSDNDAKFFDLSSGSPVNDVNKTNHFLYDENNNAAYVNFSRDFKKFDVQFGLRGEQTHIRTEQQIGKVKFDSTYFQLFPSAFFNYKLKKDQTLGVSLSRRIDRPGYYQLNPFLFLIDVTTYSTGRPGLLPQLTWSYELSYTIKNLHFTLGYSRSTNAQNIAVAKFTDVFPQIPSEENVTVQIPINLKSSENFGLTISAPVTITNWWNMVNNANVFYNRFNGSLGSTRLNKGKPSVDLRTNNMFTFKKGWAAELNGNYNAGRQYGFMVSEPQWSIAAGVQKTILKTRGTLRLNISDIFWTNLPRAVITYNNYVEKWHAYRESRVANLTFTYRFGSSKVQAARRRNTGSEEERQRAGQ